MLLLVLMLSLMVPGGDHDGVSDDDDEHVDDLRSC